MNHLFYKDMVPLAVSALLAVAACSCSDDFSGPDKPVAGRLAFEFSANIEQDNSTRADESGFADGDRFGAFVVNYSSGEPGMLTLSDNQVNNVAIAYGADANRWTPATDIYWRDPQTPADVYGYYPFNNGLGDVEAYNFEVRADQSIAGGEGEMGAYEASDFLWAKATRVEPGTKITLAFTHRFAGVKVTLEKGGGFTGDEWEKLPRIVTVDNTLRTAAIDLSTGVATATGSFDRNVVMNPDGDGIYRAVVVPQAVADGKTTIGITIDGYNYSYSRQGGMAYTAGKLHTFTIRVDKKQQSGGYSLTLVNEAITPWVADNSSHDFEANSYFVVDVPVAGTLKDCLAKAGADYQTVRNLKITGQLTDEDFRFMREDMSMLTAVNLKEAKMADIVIGEFNENGEWIEKTVKGLFPNYAFLNKATLRRIVLPEDITELGARCFQDNILSGTIIIPESVRTIGNGAFLQTQGNFTIVLPSKLEKVDDIAFASSSASMELRLSNILKHIGYRAFMNTPNVYGAFTLPTELEYLGEECFDGCGTNLTGEILIPQSIKEIPKAAFCNMGFSNGVVLKFHDGVSSIGTNAFSRLTFSTPLSFPKSLTNIEEGAFYGCKFAGELVLPETVSIIEPNAFCETNIKGTFQLPQSIESFGGRDMGGYFNNGPFSGTSIERLILGNNVEIIKEHANVGCYELSYLEIGKNVSFIGEEAFVDCPGISTIVCLAKEPPTLKNSAFRDVDFAHCVVEVPEESVDAYRRASGWSSFPSITPHHELSLSRSEFKCLNKGLTREIIVRSEGAWEIAEKPDWIHVSPDHADYKEGITVKIDPLPQGAGNREGTIQFRLKESGYTNYMTVNQYDLEQEEDKEIVLQTANGNGKAIPIFIIGEGYGAESIINGDYMKRVEETIEQFFAIEPYKTYRNMFSVSTAISLSIDNLAGDIVTPRDTKFSLTFPEIDTGITTNLKDYVKSCSSNIDDSNISDALIIILSNYNAFGGSSYICTDDRCSIACIGISDDIYPYDNRGLVQRYAGGEAFAGLADESISHIENIKGCTCPFCNGLPTYHSMKAQGLFENVTISGNMNDAPWSQFIFNPKYSALVDMYEGGYGHIRGVWRSEPESVMGNWIPYYNTISRYAIYKHIMRHAGLPASLEEFIANDKIELPQ